MKDNEIRIRFELESGDMGKYAMESQFVVWEDLGETELDNIGMQFNTFLKQVGYVRQNNYLCMQDLTEEELEAVQDYIAELRERGKDVETDGERGGRKRKSG